MLSSLCAFAKHSRFTVYHHKSRWTFVSRRNQQLCQQPIGDWNLTRRQLKQEDLLSEKMLFFKNFKFWNRIDSLLKSLYKDIESRWRIFLLDPLIWGTRRKEPSPKLVPSLSEFFRLFQVIPFEHFSSTPRNMQANHCLSEINKLEINLLNTCCRNWLTQDAAVCKPVKSLNLTIWT